MVSNTSDSTPMTAKEPKISHISTPRLWESFSLEAVHLTGVMSFRLIGPAPWKLAKVALGKTFTAEGRKMPTISTLVFGNHSPSALLIGLEDVI